MDASAPQPGIQDALTRSAELDSAMETLADLARSPGFLTDSAAQGRYRTVLVYAHELAVQLADELGAALVRIDIQVGREKERSQAR